MYALNIHLNFDICLALPPPFFWISFQISTWLILPSLVLLESDRYHHKKIFLGSERLEGKKTMTQLDTILHHSIQKLSDWIWYISHTEFVDFWWLHMMYRFSLHTIHLYPSDTWSEWILRAAVIVLVSHFHLFHTCLKTKRGGCLLEYFGGGNPYSKCPASISLSCIWRTLHHDTISEVSEIPMLPSPHHMLIIFNGGDWKDQEHWYINVEVS